jgi:hypothetical protein
LSIFWQNKSKTKKHFSWTYKKIKGILKRDFVDFFFGHPTRPGLLGLMTTGGGILILMTVFW